MAEMLNRKQLEDAAGCDKRLFGGCQMIHICSIDNTDSHIAAAKTALAYLNMLKRMEWAFLYRCPVCDGSKKQGHKPGCELGKLLKESEG